MQNSLKHQLDSLTSENNKTRVDNQQKEKQIIELNNQLKNMFNELSKERQAKGEKEIHIQTVQNSLQQTISDLNSRLNTVSTELSKERQSKKDSEILFQTKQNSLKQQLEYLYTENKRTNEICEDKDRNLNELNSQLKTLSQELTKERQTKTELDILIYNKQQQLDFQTTENQRLNLMCEEKDRNNIKITSQLKNLSTDLSQAKENVIVKEDQQREQIDNIWGQLLREQTEKEKIRKQLTSEIEKLSKELHNERKEKSHIDNLFTTQGRGQQELAEKLEKSQQEKDRIISSLESNLRQQQINFNQLNNKINELNLQLKDKDGIIQDQQNLIDPLRRELREIQENNALVNNSELLHFKEELDNEKKRK